MFSSSDQSYNFSCMTLILVSFFILISHTTSVGMTLTLVSFFISHTTLVGMTLILVSFFILILIIIILATKFSSI